MLATTLKRGEYPVNSEFYSCNILFLRTVLCNCVGRAREQNCRHCFIVKAHDNEYVMEQRQHDLPPTRIAFSDDEDSDASGPTPVPVRWECPRCTMVNATSVMPCVMCYLLPPGPSAHAVLELHAVPVDEAPFAHKSSLSCSSGAPEQLEEECYQSAPNNDSWQDIAEDSSSHLEFVCGDIAGAELIAEPTRPVATPCPPSDPTVWDAQLPHFAPIHFLMAQAARGDREVHVDYLAQFGGSASAHDTAGVGASAAVRFPCQLDLRA